MFLKCALYYIETVINSIIFIYLLCLCALWCFLPTKIPPPAHSTPSLNHLPSLFPYWGKLYIARNIEKHWKHELFIPPYSLRLNCQRFGKAAKTKILIINYQCFPPTK